MFFRYRISFHIKLCLKAVIAIFDDRTMKGFSDFATLNSASPIR